MLHSGHRDAASGHHRVAERPHFVVKAIVNNLIMAREVAGCLRQRMLHKHRDLRPGACVLFSQRKAE